MIRAPDGAWRSWQKPPLRRRLATAAVISLGALVAPTPASPQDAPSGRDGGASRYEMELSGPAQSWEGFPSRWAVRYGPRPLVESVDGYDPPGSFESYWTFITTTEVVAGTVITDKFPWLERIDAATLPTIWEEPVEFVWTFGDSEPFSTGERTNFVYRFDDVGTFTVTVEMKTVSSGVTVATAQRVVEVQNQDPTVPDLTAVRIMDGDATFDFAAEVYDAGGDTAVYEWDFGDGSTETSEVPWVRHRFELTGTYPVTLTVTDPSGAQGSRTARVEVLARPEDAASAQSVGSDGEPAATTVVTGLNARVAGAFGADMLAEIRPFTGIFLGPLRRGVCRYQMTAWDPRNLLMMTLMVDLGDMPPEGGRYEVQPTLASLTAFPDSAAYRESYGGGASLFEDAIAARLGGAIPGDTALTAQVNRGLRSAGAGLVQVGRREEQEYGGSPVARSSLGIEEGLYFERRGSGEVVLEIRPHDRIEGSVFLTLVDDDQGSVSVTGSFLLNLDAAPRDGIVNYACGDGPFRVTEFGPSGEGRLRNRGAARVHFNRDIDPSSVDPATFQVGYPPADGGDLVTVPGRFLKEDRRVQFVPDQPWLPGVRYTARVRTGPDGVRSRGGAPLESEDGSPWDSGDFWTHLDFEAQRGSYLSCHVMQAARDVPLVPGKGTVARIYASWPDHPEIAEGAQVRELDVRVVGLGDPEVEKLSTLHTFVRPDLWEHLGVDLAGAAHTANLFGWTPTEKGSRRSLRFGVELRREGEWREHAQVWCPVQVWDHSPRLVVDWYVAQVGEWEDGVPDADLEAARRVTAAAETLALQQLPFSHVEFRERGLLPVRTTGSIDDLCGFGSQTVDCLHLDMAEVGGLDHSPSSADAIVTFASVEDLEGGGAKDKIAVDGFSPVPGRITIALESFALTEGWATMAIVHELGHTFLLEHKPYLAIEDVDPEAEARAHLQDLRQLRTAFKHRGIEGFRISRGCKEGWNKSSSEGNGESESMAPLMFPVSLQPEDTWIARDHYLKLMDVLPRSALFPDVEIGGCPQEP